MWALVKLVKPLQYKQIGLPQLNFLWEGRVLAPKPFSLWKAAGGGGFMVTWKSDLVSRGVFATQRDKLRITPLALNCGMNTPFAPPPF